MIIPLKLTIPRSNTTLWASLESSFIYLKFEVKPQFFFFFFFFSKVQKFTKWRLWLLSFPCLRIQTKWLYWQFRWARWTKERAALSRKRRTPQQQDAKRDKNTVNWRKNEKKALYHWRWCVFSQNNGLFEGRKGGYALALDVGSLPVWHERLQLGEDVHVLNHRSSIRRIKG